MEKLYENSETGCCPRFNPRPWNEKQINWNEKIFLKDHVKSFLHIPLTMGKVIVRDAEKIKNSGALPEVPLMLFDENSMWGADIYIAVEKPVPGTETAKISGTFLSKVFEGHYKNSGKWAKEMKEFVKTKGKEIKKLYFFYTTCPACAKAYGKNYTVLLAEI